MGAAPNSFTIHPGVAEFKGEWYLFYHVGTLAVGDQTGAMGRRAVAVEKMEFNPDGTIKHVAQTGRGVSVLPGG